METSEGRRIVRVAVPFKDLHALLLPNDDGEWEIVAAGCTTEDGLHRQLWLYLEGPLVREVACGGVFHEVRLEDLP